MTSNRVGDEHVWQSTLSRRTKATSAIGKGALEPSYRTAQSAAVSRNRCSTITRRKCTNGKRWPHPVRRSIGARRSLRI